jgi:GNAT superfamily N-acetyltransferase
MTDTDVSPLKRIKNYFETRNFLLNYVYYICDPSCKYGYYAFKNGENERRVMRIIRPSPDDLADIMTLQDFVCQNLDNKDWYYSSTEEEIKTALNDKENYLCLQIVDHDRIIAFAYVIMNPDSKHSLSHDTKNHEFEKGECVFETVFVHPDYRGFGIQKLLLEVLSDWAQKQGGKTLWATVHPDNIYSAKNFQENGFHIASVEPIEKYGSKRNYYKKVLGKNKRKKSDDYIIFPYI